MYDVSDCGLVLLAGVGPRREGPDDIRLDDVEEFEGDDMGEFEGDDVEGLEGGDVEKLEGELFVEDLNW